MAAAQEVAGDPGNLQRAGCACARLETGSALRELACPYSGTGEGCRYFPRLLSRVTKVVTVAVTEERGLFSPAV